MRIGRNLEEFDDPIELREDFLRRLAQGLSRNMSPFERDDIVKEVRTHLVASSAAFEELGLNSIDAMKEAIERFGDAERIKRQLSEQVRPPRPEFLPASLSIVVSFVIGGVLLTLADFAIYLTGVVSHPSEGSWMIGGVIGSMVGWAIYRRPRRPLVSAVRAGLIVPSTLLVAVSLLNGRLPDATFATVFLVGIGICEFAVGFLAAHAIHVVTRDCHRTGRPPAALE
ncbi:MAG: permease prefix domain 1-containing protein [Fimbriimonas sp.]|nr:permease prefix domain 1-containing protein [Fimbriimonas sp.]